MEFVELADGTLINVTEIVRIIPNENVESEDTPWQIIYAMDEGSEAYDRNLISQSDYERLRSVMLCESPSGFDYRPALRNIRTEVFDLQAALVKDETEQVDRLLDKVVRSINQLLNK